MRKQQERDFNQSKGPKGFSVSPQKTDKVNTKNDTQNNFTIMQIDDQSSAEKDKKRDEANMTLGDEGKFAVPEIMDKQIEVSLDPKKHLSNGQKQSSKSQVKIKLK